MKSKVSTHHLRSFENQKAKIFMESSGTKWTIRIVRSCLKNFWYWVDLDNKKGDRLVVGEYRNGPLVFEFMERFNRGVSTILKFEIIDLNASVFSDQFNIGDMESEAAETHLRERLRAIEQASR